MPGHGKGEEKQSPAAVVSSMNCWDRHLISDRIYEIQAGRRVHIGWFNHCIRRDMSLRAQVHALQPLEILNHATSECSMCRYETTRWDSACRVWLFKTKLKRDAVLALMAEQLDKGLARGSMEIRAPGVRYTAQETASNDQRGRVEDLPPLPATVSAQAKSEIISEEAIF